MSYKNKNAVPLVSTEERRKRRRKMLEKHLDRLRHGCYNVKVK